MTSISSIIRQHHGHILYSFPYRYASTMCCVPLAMYVRRTRTRTMVLLHYEYC